MEEWKRRGPPADTRKSADHYRSYRKMYNEQLERSLEIHRSIEKVKEQKVNRFVYGDVVKHMAGFQQRSSLDKIPKTFLVPNKEKEHAKALEEMRMKKDIGNKYLKQSIEVAREVHMAPKLYFKPKKDSPRDEGFESGLRADAEKHKKRGLSKEDVKKYYNVHDIFRQRDKPVDDKGQNYSKLEAIRRVDQFTSPETQTMATKTIKDIDRELKIKEKEIKNGVSKDEDIDKHYLRSIKTKIEVINQRVTGTQQAYAERAQSGQPNKRVVKVDVVKRAEDLRQQRAKSALRPGANATPGSPNRPPTDLDWYHITATLSFGDDPQSKAKRLQLWKLTDVNGNGLVSLAEVDKALRDVLCLDAVFNCKKAIIRAFTAAKNAVASKNPHGADYIEKSEFRHLLYYLRQYFEYWQAFSRVDSGADARIDLKEFRAAVPKLQKWVGLIQNPDAEFKQMDKNGGGQVLFDEFVEWAFKRSLDIDDDDMGPNGSQNVKPGVPKQGAIHEKNKNEKPTPEDIKQKKDQVKDKNAPTKPNFTQKDKGNHKEIHLPVAEGISNTPKERGGLDPISPANSVSEKDRKGIIKEDLNHPLMKKLSEDLDEDPSESIDVSHQKRKQQELGEYYDHKQSKPNGNLNKGAAKQPKQAAQDNYDEDF